MLTTETEPTLPIEEAILPGLGPLPNETVPPALLETDSLVELIETLFDGVDGLDDLADLAETVVGTVVFDNGVVTANLTSSAGDLTGSVDLAAEINELADDLTGLTGTATLGDGLLVGEISGLFPDDPTAAPFTFDLDLESLVDMTLTSLLEDWDDSFTVANGQVPISIPTAFGDIAGTLSFLPGEVGIDLTTPFGDLDETLTIPDGLQFSSGGIVLDLETGEIIVDTLPGLPFGNVTLPLTSLTFDVTVEDGIATVSVPVEPLGPFEATFDLAQVARDFVLTPFFSTAEGTLAIAEGIFTSSFVTPYGSFDNTLDVGGFLTTLATDAATLNGTLTFDGGTVVSDVTGSFGDFDQTINLVALLDDLADLFA